jgi:hypothetical protein
VRAALGSGQSRLIWQVLTEGLLLSGHGAIPGVAIAALAIWCFRVVNPIELSAARGRDGQSGRNRVLARADACHDAHFRLASRSECLTDRFESEPEDCRPLIAGRNGLAKTVIAIQIALSFVPPTGAGLLMTSALRMAPEPLVFTTDHVLIARVSVPVFRVQQYFTGNDPLGKQIRRSHAVADHRRSLGLIEQRDVDV